MDGAKYNFRLVREIVRDMKSRRFLTVKQLQEEMGDSQIRCRFEIATEKYENNEFIIALISITVLKDVDQ